MLVNNKMSTNPPNELGCLEIKTVESYYNKQGNSTDECCNSGKCDENKKPDENLGDYCAYVATTTDLESILTQLLSSNPSDTTQLIGVVVQKVTDANSLELKWKVVVWVTIGSWRICVEVRKKA